MHWDESKKHTSKELTDLSKKSMINKAVNKEIKKTEAINKVDKGPRSVAATKRSLQVGKLYVDQFLSESFGPPRLLKYIFLDTYEETKAAYDKDVIDTKKAWDEKRKNVK